MAVEIMERTGSANWKAKGQMTEQKEENLKSFIAQRWTDDVIPQLCEYIKIPNMSPFFDKEVLTNGHQDKAMQLIVDWVSNQDVKGMKVEVVRENGRTPLLFIEIEPSQKELGEKTGTVLMYGHMDKQPPFEGWREDLDPYVPVIQDGKLFGRGGADDGYAAFCAILSIEALQKQGIAHSRIVILIEGSEESGSPDLIFYVEKLKDRIQRPNLVVCLDSGCGNYEQLWVTSSLRGVIGGHLNVKMITEGVHSGDASGVVPGTFRILRTLLDRVEDSASGEIVQLPEFYAQNFTAQRDRQVKLAAKVLGREGFDGAFPFVESGRAVTQSVEEMAMNRWWKPQLVITGADGLPSCEVAGNVLRPETKVTLSLRLPPTVDAKKAALKLQSILTQDPPYGSQVSFEGEKAANGWAAPEVSPWLESAVQSASEKVFSKPCVFQGEGGSIPFMGMLGEMFPKAQFCVVGVLGPQSNAHGPNEFLHIDYSCKLTNCISLILRDHCAAEVETLI